MPALCGVASEWGYDITGIDVLNAYAAVMAAASAAGVDENVVKGDMRALIAVGWGGESTGEAIEVRSLNRN